MTARIREFELCGWWCSGLWFAAMNYSVHTAMYLYYFASFAGVVVKPMSPFITCAQVRGERSQQRSDGVVWVFAEGAPACVPRRDYEEISSLLVQRILNFWNRM